MLIFSERSNSQKLFSELRAKVLKPICEGGVVKEIQITEDSNGVSWLLGVLSFAKSIKYIDEDLFEIKEGRYGVAIVMKYRTRHISHHFVKLVRYAPRYIKKTFPYHSFEPSVDLFIQMLRGKNGVSQIVHALDHQFSAVLAADFCEDLNNFVRQYRMIITSNDFKAIVRRRKRAAHKNYQTLTNLVSDLFAFRSRLLIVRLDLYYPSDFAGTELTGVTVAAERIAKDRTAFIHSLERSSISRYLLDFAWKVEFSERKGFHFHWLFIFDGAKVRQDIPMGRRLGELWEQVIGYKAVYWNCNAEKHRYDLPGLGMGSRGDIKLLSGLDRVNNYLTKPDYFLALSRQKVGDTFGTWSKGKKLRRRTGKCQMRVISNSICGSF